MISFNNEKIKKYDLDDFNSIINRISSNMSTLPKFLYFKNGIPITEDFLENKNIMVEDIREIIKKSKDISDLYKKLNSEKDKIEHKFSVYEIVEYYIILNENFNEIYLHASDYPILKEDTIKNIIDSLKEYNITYVNVENIWNTRLSRIIKLQKDIENNIKKWNDDSDIIKEFENFENLIPVNYSKFELEKVNYNIELKFDNITSIIEIFNLIKLNNQVPFAVTNNFYKILKDFTPPLSWNNLFDKSKRFSDKYKNIDRQKNIILKILNEKKIKNINSYTECILSIKEIQNSSCIVNVKLLYNKSKISKDKIKNDILSIFDKDLDKNEIIEKDDYINGIFFISKQSLNTYVMLDMIMNDKLFSNLLVVNESVLSKKNNKIHIYFENTTIGKISFKILLKKVLKNDKFNKILYPDDSLYLRIKISKAEDIDKVILFQNLFSKLITYYNNTCDEIINIYKTHFLDIGICETYKETIKINEEPELFPKGYKSNICQKNVRPSIITLEEAEEAEKSGINILKFPKDNEFGIEPKYFICDNPKNPKFKYPGLKVNTLENKNIFPYLPCCYEDIQTNKPEYLNYYEGLEIKDTKKIGGVYIYKTGKILNDDEHGELPKNIVKLFTINDNDSLYYRQGVIRDKNSFIHCILKTKNINKSIKKIKKELIKPNYIACCKQEMYDYTEDQIKEKIESDDYFDPKLFLHALEVYLECNIFLFNYENDGQMILPRYTKNYIKNKNTNDCIFIYEHMGSSADNATYPQCELIVKQPDQNNKYTIDIFNYKENNSLCKYINNIFNRLTSYYIFNNKIDVSNFNWPWLGAFSQKIDSYGKTRVINIEYKDKFISIFTEPIQPLNLNISNEIYKTDQNTALEILNELNYNESSLQIIKNEVKGIIGNIDVSILIDSNSIVKNNKEYSIISEYNKYKKLSRYVIEYLYWLFSNYLKDNNIKEITTDTYKNFKNQYIDIDKNFEYNDIPKFFDIKNNGIMFNEKLIVKSEDVLKRLFYILRLSLIENNESILTYYKKTMIQNYYLDVTDFNTYNFQLILEGEKSFVRLISENIKNIIYDTVNIKNIETQISISDEDDDEDEEEYIDNSMVDEYEDSENKFKKLWDIPPYFFKNKLISNKIYLAQNTDSYLKAIEIATIWNKKKYNPGNMVKESELKKFSLYSIINGNKIKKYTIFGKNNDLNIKVLGYKTINPYNFNSV